MQLTTSALRCFKLLVLCWISADFSNTYLESNVSIELKVAGALRHIALDEDIRIYVLEYSPLYQSLLHHYSMQPSVLLVVRRWRNVSKLQNL